MIRPSKREISALTSLEHHPDFVVIVDWLRRSLAEHDSNWRSTSDNDSLRKLQGRASELADLLGHAESARETLQKMR